VERGHHSPGGRLRENGDFVKAALTTAAIAAALPLSVVLKMGALFPLSTPYLGKSGYASNSRLPDSGSNL